VGQKIQNFQISTEQLNAFSVSSYAEVISLKTVWMACSMLCSKLMSVGSCRFNRWVDLVFSSSTAVLLAASRACSIGD